MDFEILNLRATLLERLRGFFRNRGFLEVETPLAAREAIPERHIDLVQLTDDERWLQASPEMHHKRLLCAGSGPIFEVTRSFRGREVGDRHRPEFTLVEWYRPGDDMEAGMRLLDGLIGDLLDAGPARRTTYREAFQRALGIDPHTAEIDGLRTLAEAALGQSLAGEANRDELLNAVFAIRVEPGLGGEGPELLCHYPASQGALAKTTVDQHGIEVAERFELYVDGLELANGYHELTDPVELRRRLKQARDERIALDRPVAPMPERLLDAMTDPGLPPCAGVALGFDRVVMLAAGAERISDVNAISDPY